MSKDNELCTRNRYLYAQDKKTKTCDIFASPSLLAKYLFFFELLLISHLAVVFFIVPLFTQALVSTSGCHVNVTVDSRIYKKGYSL